MDYQVTYLDRSGHHAHAILTAESGEAALRLAKGKFDDVLKVRRVDEPRSHVGKFAIFMFFLGIVLLLVLLTHVIGVFVGN